MKNKSLIASLTSIAVVLACTAEALAQVPAAVQVPAGNKAAMTARGAGDLTYECRKATAAADPYAETYEWTFAGPNAVLYDAKNTAVGKYYAGPTWEHQDGSKVSGKQLAVAPGTAGSIPLQLVQAGPATGQGAMTGVTYIQRVNTVGGIAPKEKPCTAANVGAKELVKYQADYVFYKAGS